mmetsp:Transcript_14576/g.17683  ORF Transcript_14576/g.17683 Transcript_14576/m.17683 type:complete len:112 (+) Transcript_14576:682-1017(+)
MVLLTSFVLFARDRSGQVVTCKAGRNCTDWRVALFTATCPKVEIILYRFTVLTEQQYVNTQFFSCTIFEPIFRGFKGVCSKTCFEQDCHNISLVQVVFIEPLLRKKQGLET